MPLPDGTLTSAEFATAVERLNELWAMKEPRGQPRTCPSCGNSSFFFHPHLLGNHSDWIGAVKNNYRLPTVAVYCQRCGHVEQYVAARLGIEVLDVNDPGRDLPK